MTEKILKSTEQIIKMVNSGIPIEEAYSLVKPGRELTRDAKREMLAKAARYSLTNEKRVRKAASVVDKILKGEALDKEGIIKPRSSDIVRIVEMIKDREEPKVTINQNMNINVDLAPVDLNKYRTIDIDIDNQ